MGSNKRYLIIIIFFVHSELYAQVTTDFHSTDSLTYLYYNTGDWNELIKAGKDAISRGIDYKFLRQRLGYAYFSEGDYFEARSQFEKALSFDSYNSFSLEYLYYSYLNTGKEEFAGVIEQRLSPELKKALKIRPLKALESIDLEYNFKYAASEYRSNPQYIRIGIKSKLGYRLSVYQSFSNYYQSITIKQIGYTVKVNDRQPEYYAILNWNVTKHLLLKTAYHLINSNSGISATTGNLFLLAISPDLNRYPFEVYGSLLTIGKEIVYQAGMEGGVVFPGRSNFYVTGKASGIFQENKNRFIYGQKAGLKITKRAWIEGNAIFGRMTNFNDYDGMYLYNSFDPMIFRTGATLMWYLRSNITLWTSFSFEEKEYFENSIYHYNQFSYLGGIRWKL